jgi:hypothetical protein
LASESISTIFPRDVKLAPVAGDWSVMLAKSDARMREA